MLLAVLFTTIGALIAYYVLAVVPAQQALALGTMHDPLRKPSKPKRARKSSASAMTSPVPSVRKKSSLSVNTSQQLSRAKKMAVVRPNASPKKLSAAERLANVRRNRAANNGMDKSRRISPQKKNGRRVSTGANNPADQLIDHVLVDDIKYVDNFVKNGGDVNIQSPTRSKMTALHRAAEKNHMRVGELLLKHGANVDAKDVNGWTPLQVASQLNSRDMVRMLIAACANVDIQNKNGATALFKATQFNQVKVVKMLLAAGADSSLGDIDGQTPMHIGAMKNSIEAVKLLLQQGQANVDIRNKHGTTPLFCSVVEQNLDITRTCIEAAADVNISSVNAVADFTALHVAAHDRNLRAVEMLLAAGAKKGVRYVFRNQSESPREMALRQGFGDVVSLLDGNPMTIAKKKFRIPTMQEQSQYKKNASVCACPCCLLRKRGIYSQTAFKLENV